MTDCEHCPVIERVEKLEKKMDQIQSETKQNDRAITGLSKDLAIHMHTSQEQSAKVEKGIENLSALFDTHMKDEKETIKEIKTHFNETIKPVSEKMKHFDGIKLKNGIMWAIMVSLAGALLSAFLFVAQQKYTEYREQQKLEEYTDSERAAFLKFKAKQIEKRVKANEKSNN